MRIAVAAAALAAIASTVGLPLVSEAQQAYPTRQVTLVVPFPAGSTTDNVARKFAEFMRAATNVPVIVDNRVGADGNVAAQTVLREPPAGYVVFFTGNSVHGANANVHKDMPFDPINDFAMVGGVMTLPMVLTVRPDFPASNAKEFVAEANKRKKPLFFATGNMSTRGAAELFKARFGIQMEHVPYRGSPQVVADLIGGQFDCAFIDANTVRAFLREGRLKGLAITSDKRLATLPNIPTVAEDLPGFEMGAWVGVVVRSQTPPEVVAKLSSLVQSFAKDAGTIKYLESINSTPLQLNAQQLKTFVEEETKKWAEIVKVANIKQI